MHIVIDARRIREQTTGIGNYVSHLLEELPGLAPEDHITALVNQESFSRVKHFRRLCFYHTSWSLENHWGGDLWRQCTLPLILKYIQADIFHDPGYLLPFAVPGVPMVVTIHDLAHYQFPETNTWKYNAYMRLMTWMSVRRSTKILTDSHAISGEIQKKFSIPSDKLAAVPLGVGAEFHPADDQEKLLCALEALELQHGYIFAASTLEPRKNFPFLLKVYQQIRETSSQEIPLVISGLSGWKNQAFYELLSSHPYKKSIHLMGYVSQENLIALYQGSALFVMPSLYEGFGLPVLEAMACGTPVIASWSTSLPEIVEKAGLLCSPHDETEWVEACKKVLEDKDLSKELSVKGPIQARKFTWKECARKTLQVYREVLNGNLVTEPSPRSKSCQE